jgi:hypothetical protein
MQYYKQGLSLLGLLIVVVSNALAANLKPLSLQQSTLVAPDSAISTMQMPRLDNRVLQQNDFTNPTPAQRFSETQTTLITPKTHGIWETITTRNSIKRIWRMTIKSSGAISLNVVFTKFKMPKGGELFIYAPGHKQILGPYTQNNTSPTNKLWTPLILGDTIIVEVNLPASKANELVLELTKVNHGYKAATAKTTGSCNIDVACPAGDTWQDQIRSVVMFTFESKDQLTGNIGLYVCSGSMINNTAQDNTPYLLTANHCDVNAANSDTVVIYWNYQNSQCRVLNSANNANAGDGLRTQSLVGGASLVANYTVTDFRLLKTNNPIPTEYNVFFAGWDRSQVSAPVSAASIHHPNGEEKRISLVTNPQLLILDSNGVQNMPKVNDSHIRVVWWSAGTTEGGSSGSPLFDQNQRIVGQLSGGAASCSKRSQSDWYGRFKLSWDGDTINPAAANRLSDWLDPNNTGATFINGKNATNSSNTDVLQNAVPKQIAKAANQSSKNFTITIPVGASNLHIMTQGGTADADLYVKFASIPTLVLYDDRSWSETSNEDIFIPKPEIGIYHIKVYGFSDYSNVTLTASYDIAGTIIKTFISTLDVKIINEATISSSIASNYNNSAGTMTVHVDIKHTDSNDLSINLIAPNNQIFTIKNKNRTTVSQNYIQTLDFTVPAGITNGLWKLEVQDSAKLDTGYIDSWEITLP